MRRQRAAADLDQPGFGDRWVGRFERLPAPALYALCGLIVAMVAWAAVDNPLPVLAGVVLWAAILFRRRLGAGLDRLSKPRDKAATPIDAMAFPAEFKSGLAFIAPDLRLEGRLTGAGRVELFGQLSGEVECDALRVHPGGALRGQLLYREMGVAADAVFEGAATRAPDPPEEIQTGRPDHLARPSPPRGRLGTDSRRRLSSPASRKPRRA